MSISSCWEVGFPTPGRVDLYLLFESSSILSNIGEKTSNALAAQEGAERNSKDKDPDEALSSGDSELQLRNNEEQSGDQNKNENGFWRKNWVHFVCFARNPKFSATWWRVFTTAIRCVFGTTDEKVHAEQGERQNREPEVSREARHGWNHLNTKRFNDVPCTKCCGLG